MKIYLNEITDQGTDLDFTEEQSWVKDAVLRLDEHPLEGPNASSAGRSVRVHYTLRKIDEIVVISGSFKTHVELLCSRCGVSFKHICDSGFSGLYCTDPVMAGVGHLKEPGKPGGQNQGFARHAHQEQEAEDQFTSDDTETLGKDLDITYVPEDKVDLGDVLTEQIHFKIPLQPLCNEGCKGVCTNCGTDLNAGQCACAKLAKRNTAFSVLENFKF